MKLCRFGDPGAETPGILDNEGRIRDLSSACSDIDSSVLSPAGLKKLAAVDISRLPIVKNDVRLGVPFRGISKFIGIGLNYSDHAAEAGMPTPTEPIIFLKANSSISGPDDDVIQPRGSLKLDWEVELAVVIGSPARYVSKENALDYVSGYCIVNDVSDRGFQLQSSQWDKGKGCDTFGPIGPWLVTKDEVEDPQNLDLWLDVNGVRRQSGNTRTMIFGVRELVSYCSHYMTLAPGDIIATGTPPGVAMSVKPEPAWLKPGDLVELGVHGLGKQKHRVVAAQS
jgi:2,4-didehydro-3-deoxy-L-rhamnonate hydrolase